MVGAVSSSRANGASRKRRATPPPSRARQLLRSLWMPALVLGVGLSLFSRQSGPDEGTLASDFDLPVVSGAASRFQLAAHRGTPVVVEAFASWCRACRSAAPILDEAARAKRAAPVRFVAVSVDDSAQAAAGAARKWGIGFDVAWDDGDFAAKYEIAQLPTLVVIDREGRVQHSATGRVSRAELERWLTELGAPRTE